MLSVEETRRAILCLQSEINFLNIQIDHKKHEIEQVKLEIDDIKNQIEMLEFGTTDSVNEAVNLWMKSFNRNSLFINVTILPLISGAIAVGLAESLSSSISLIKAIIILAVTIAMYICFALASAYYINKLTSEPKRFNIIVNKGRDHLESLRNAIGLAQTDIKNKNISLNELYVKLEDKTKTLLEYSQQCL